MNITIKESAAKTFDEVFKDDKCYGFYDWFCKDAELPEKARELKEKADTLAYSKRFDPAVSTYFFHNCCPCVGPFYDALKVCDADGRVLYCICIGDEREECRFAVYGRENDFAMPLYQSNKWTYITAWFEKWEKTPLTEGSEK